MGLFDTVTFEAGLDIEFPEIGADPFEISWQTKSITRHQPLMETYNVTAAGRLVKKEVEYERVPEEERPGYNDDIDGFETSMSELRGCIKQVHQGWSDTAYHGTFEFHRTIDDDYVSLEATFTEGQLVAIIRNE